MRKLSEAMGFHAVQEFSLSDQPPLKFPDENVGCSAEWFRVKENLAGHNATNRNRRYLNPRTASVTGPLWACSKVHRADLKCGRYVSTGPRAGYFRVTKFQPGLWRE